MTRMIPATRQVNTFVCNPVNNPLCHHHPPSSADIVCCASTSVGLWGCACAWCWGCTTSTITVPIVSLLVGAGRGHSGSTVGSPTSDGGCGANSVEFDWRPGDTIEFDAGAEKPPGVITGDKPAKFELTETISFPCEGDFGALSLLFMLSLLLSAPPLFLHQPRTPVPTPFPIPFPVPAGLLEPNPWSPVVLKDGRDILVVFSYDWIKVDDPSPPTKNLSLYLLEGASGQLIRVRKPMAITSEPKQVRS